MVKMAARPLLFFFLIVLSEARNIKRNTCGETLTASSGQFSSPGYPSYYDLELLCSWTIKGADDVTEITINFEDFDIEWGMNCMFDSVVVKDKDSNVLGTLCGSGPRSVVVPGNLAVITMTTDDYDGMNKGFKAKYQMTQPVKKGDCNFDKPCADWTDADAATKWMQSSSDTGSSASLPRKDHSGNGGYKYVHGVQADQNAVLQSPLFSKKQCLRFFYYMYGLYDVGTLRVYSQQPGASASELWSLSGNHGHMWKEVDVPLNIEDSYQVLIEAEAGSQPNYDAIAIDDISLIPIEECKLEPACGGGELTGAEGSFKSQNFPQEYPHFSRCSWKIKAPAGSAGILVVFSTFDLHPKQSENFVLVKGSSGQETKIYGTHHTDVGVKVLGDQAEVILHTGYNINSHKGFQARYQAIPYISPEDCDFDSGICSGWKSEGQLAWTANKGITPSLYTGPHGDTLAIGGYVFMESSEAVEGTKARLVSPALKGTKCLHFAYSMLGQEMGTINVLVLDENGAVELIWKQQGNHGREWHRATTSLVFAEDQEYKIIFEGVVGRSFTSDAALDDITFTEGECPSVKECGGILAGSEGSIRNPSFSGAADCTWQIVPPQEYSEVSLSISTDLQTSVDCSSEYVQIQDKFGTQIGEKLCGQRSSEAVNIGFGGAKVVYHTENNVKNALSILYQAGGKRSRCGGKIKSGSGSFSSPNYPSSYPRDEVCEWEITAPGASSVKVFFEFDFDIHDTGVGCAYSYLSLSDQQGNEVARLCGSTKPLPVLVPGNTVTAQFKSDVYQTAKGFKASFVSY